MFRISDVAAAVVDGRVVDDGVSVELEGVVLRQTFGAAKCHGLEGDGEYGTEVETLGPSCWAATSG